MERLSPFRTALRSSKKIRNAVISIPLAFLLFYAAVPAWAEILPYRVVGQIGGACNAVAVSGTYAYIGEGPNLVVLSLANPAAPAYIGRVLLDNLVQDIAVSGNKAYVALQETGIAIVDVTNKSAPKKLGGYVTPAQAWNVDVSGSMVYVACENLTQGTNNSGLLILNASNPAALALVNYLNTFDVRDVDVFGNYAFCSGGPYLRVVDITSPASASLKKTVSLPSFGNGRALRAADQKLYVCIDNASPTVGLQIYDISTPLNPVKQGNCAEAYQPYDVALAGSTALVANLNGGLTVINVSNPSNPAFVSNLSLSGQTQKVAGAGAYAYTAQIHGGFGSINLSSPASPSVAENRSIAAEPNGARLVRGVAYVADATRGLQFFDVANRTNPLFLGSHAIDHYGAAEDVEVANGTAFVGGSYGAFEVVDVRNLSNPIRLSNYNAPSWVSQVAVQGDYVFLACQLAGTMVLNKSNPTSLTQVTMLAAPKADDTSPNNAFSVKVSGNTVYVGYGNVQGGLQILNFNPTKRKLTETGRYTVNRQVYDVCLSQTRIYLSCWSNGLEIVGRVASGTPSYLGSFRTPGYTFQTALDGTTALLADAEAVQVLDAAKPSAIAARQSINLPGAIQHITPMGHGALLVSSREAGLYILQGFSATGVSDWQAYD